ncbi:hypothetical protein QJQ45_016561 [Haematococcus lacustris]|nr:hypothetical protein QJQ45_016561 [Haematococcus lacustris]
MGPRLVPLWQVDAFTDVPFAGNPTAVCLLTEPLSEQLLQSIAAENNLAETAYIEPLQPGGPPVDISHFKEHDRFRLRFFTPSTEVPLCGHATFASAATLFQELHNQHSTLHFHTLSGVLSVSQSSPQPAAGQEGAGGEQQARGMAMQMPLTPPTSALPAPFDNTPCQEGTEASGAASGAAVVVTALGSGRQFAGKAAQLLQACVGGAAIHEVLYAGDTMKYLMICLPPGTSQQQLEAIQPDFAAMLSCASGDHIRCVILTCRAGADSGYDYLLRFLAPWLGVDEDHATGSANCVLGPYWAQQLGQPGASAGEAPGGAAAAPLTMRARQCSKRVGLLTVQVREQGQGQAAGCVVLGGQAVVVLSGHMRV